MDVAAFYQRLLQPPAPWHVARVELSATASQVDVWLEHAAGVRMPCPSCGEPCPVHDHTAERVWRHLDTCESTTWLHARLPRVNCPKHGIGQVTPPMSEGSSRLTVAMESHCIDLAGECSRAGAARLSGLGWDAVDGLMRRAVARGMRRRGKGLPKRLGIDEKAVFKRHKYCAIVTDLDAGEVVEVMDGRRIKDLEPWCEARREDLAKVEDVAMDMSGAFANVIARFAPQAAIGFDRFHVTALVNRAVDEVRKQEQRTIGKDLRQWFFRSRFLPLHNAENVPADRQGQFEELKRVAVKTSRAWAIKENFRGLWQCASLGEATDFFRKWYWWAIHSRLKPMHKVAKTLKRHWQGIANAIVRKVTNACTEGLNSKIEKIKRDAYGFRSRVSLRTAILFHCGGLELYPQQART